MIFAEDYLDFDEDEAQAEWDSGFPPLLDPVDWLCPVCNEEVEWKEFGDTCPECGHVEDTAQFI
jgi:rubrerythrin